MTRIRMGLRAPGRIAAAAVLLLLLLADAQIILTVWGQSTEASSSPSITGRNPSTANFKDISYKQICPTTTTTTTAKSASDGEAETEFLQPLIVLNDTTKTIAFVVMPEDEQEERQEDFGDGAGEDEVEDKDKETPTEEGIRRMLLKRTQSIRSRSKIRKDKRRNMMEGKFTGTFDVSTTTDPVQGDFEDGFTTTGASSTVGFLANGTTTMVVRPSNERRRNFEEDYKEQDQPRSISPQTFIHFDNLTSAQQSEIFYVRKCLCPRPAGMVEEVQHFCNLQSSYCAVYDLAEAAVDGPVEKNGTAGNSTAPWTPQHGVHCYPVDMQLVVSRNAWPLVLLWYLALLLACCCTIHGFLACECLRRVCVVGHSKYQDEFLQRMNISSSATTAARDGENGGDDHDNEGSGDGDGGGGEPSHGNDRHQQHEEPSQQVQEGPESPAVVLSQRHQQQLESGQGGEGFLQYAQAIGGNFFGTARQQRRLMFEYNLWLQANWLTRHEFREEQRQNELERVEQMLMMSGSEDDGDGIELQEQRYERPHPRLELKVRRWKTTVPIDSCDIGDKEDRVQMKVPSIATTGGIYEDENETTGYDYYESTAYDTGETIRETAAETCCTICLLDLKDGDRVGDLSCRHVFHVQCLKEWSKRKNSCPLCAQPLGIVKTYDRPFTTFATSPLTMQSMPTTAAATNTNAAVDTNPNSTSSLPLGPNVDEVINRRVQRSLRHQQRRSGQNSSSRRSSSYSINRGGGLARSSNRSRELRIRRAHELALDGQGHTLDPLALRRFGRPYSELNSMQIRVMRNEIHQEERLQHQQQLRRREYTE